MRALAIIASGLFLVQTAMAFVRDGPQAFVPPMGNRAALVEFMLAKFGVVACPLVLASALVRSRGIRFGLLAVPVLMQCGSFAVLFTWKLMTHQIWINRATGAETCALSMIIFGLLVGAAGLWGLRSAVRWRVLKVCAWAGILLTLCGGGAAWALQFVFSPQGMTWKPAALIAFILPAWAALRTPSRWAPPALLAAVGLIVLMADASIGLVAALFLDWLALTAFLELMAPTEPCR